MSKFVIPIRSILPARRSRSSSSATSTYRGMPIVPPVELHEVEPLDAEPQERAIDDALDVRPVHGGQLVEVGHELGVHPEAGGVIGTLPPEAADQLLDAGVDVGAVEGGDAGLDEGRHVADGLRGVDVTVVAGQLPAALDEPRDG